jgi:hypothetical protein
MFRQTSLRPANMVVDSQAYYPVVEYRHVARQLHFAQKLDEVVVDYNTYGAELVLHTVLIRGANAFRSPYVSGGYWEVR